MWRRLLSWFVHVWDEFPYLDAFHSPLPEPFGSSLNCGTIPVVTVVCLLNMNCNVVFWGLLTLSSTSPGLFLGQLILCRKQVLLTDTVEAHCYVGVLVIEVLE